MILVSPVDSLYQGKPYLVSILLPSSWPFGPPVILFHDRNFAHQNVDPEGYYKFDVNTWSPIIRITGTVLLVQLLFAEASFEPNCIRNTSAVSSYLKWKYSHILHFVRFCYGLDIGIPSDVIGYVITKTLSIQQ
jgi:ubiquitin-protein ligase